MGNDVHRNPGIHRYDITMSRRTRKPLNLEESNKEIPRKGDGGHEGEKRNARDIGGENDNDHKKSLKQLIHGDLGDGNKCRSSLGQHFTEDKKLHLVVKQQEKVMVGVKPKGSVSHYIKALTHLIKVKQDSGLASRKNPLLPSRYRS